MSALSLLVSGVLTDDPDRTLARNDLAFLADRFYGRSNLHSDTPFYITLLKQLVGALEPLKQAGFWA